MLYSLSLILNPNTTLLFMFITLIIGTIFVSLIPTNITSSGNSTYLNLTKGFSLLVSIIPLLWSIYLWYLFDASGHNLQMVVCLSRLHLSFGLDSVSLSLTILTTSLFPLCIMLMRTMKGYLTFLLLEIVILAALNVLDLLGFYILFESSLVLLFLLIGRTSYGNIEAAYKIVLYTMAGSLILLPTIFVLYAFGGSTNLLHLIMSLSAPVSDLSSWHYLSERQSILGFGLFTVFAVKIPLMPFHLWLPEAHVAAPTAGSVLLAGVLLKLGGVGFIRFLIPILPTFTVNLFPLVCTLCIVSFLFSTLSTIRQIDLKKIVAYSSIGHMALITLTIFSLSEFSAFNATFMMIAHGLVSPALFLLVGFLYDRVHTKFLFYFTGLGSHMPLYSVILFFFILANLAFPPFPNFIAEFLCLTSIFSVHSLYAYIFCICQVLGATASFWLFNRMIQGFPGSHWVSPLSRSEISLLAPLLIGVIWLGLKPMA